MDIPNFKGGGMNLRKFTLLFVAIVLVTTSGCAYRTSSNIKSESLAALDPNTHVIISEGVLSEKKYKEIGPIEVSIKKLTVFHKDPTKRQVDEALTEKARAIGADAVINVTYESGVGLTTWGYMDAKGMGVKITK